MTNQQAIDRALYLLGFHEYGASADATDSADALSSLNEMMYQWKTEDRDFDWFEQDDLTDTVPVPKWSDRAVIYNLAIELAAKFNIQPTATVVTVADDSKRSITRHLMNTKIQGADMSHLPYGDGRNGRYNINSDTI